MTSAALKSERRKSKAIARAINRGRATGRKGGKGGGGGGIQEDKDTLRSKGILRVLDMLGEGEIKGLVDGAKSIRLNGTPIQAADGTYNIEDVSWEYRNGTPSQSPLAGFPAIQNTIAVNQAVTKGAGPVIRTSNNPNMHRVNVTLRFNAMITVNYEKGTIKGAYCDIAITWRSNGGPWQTTAVPRVDGKKNGAYERSFMFSVSGGGPYDIRVERLTDDPDDDEDADIQVSNTFSWLSYTEITDHQVSYDDTAIVALTLDPEKVGSSVPARSYLVDGRIIAVPRNYDPDTRTYATSGTGTSGGTWDGASFWNRWTDNPAWIFYDLLTNPRYGLGKHIPNTMVDKWSLYRIGQYCDELVPDGKGGTEPRFRLNAVINTREEAYRVLQAVASVFRGMVYWGSGVVTTTADRPGDPKKLVSKVNVSDGKFVYEGTALAARHSVAKVGWLDPDQDYAEQVEFVEDQESIVRYGVREVEIYGFGVTSRGQARRLGTWLLDSERHETETVRYTCDIDQADLWPGDLILIQDADYAGVEYSGRIVDATVNAITIDRPITLQAGATYAVDVVAPNGEVYLSQAITNAAGNTYTSFSFASPLPSAPVTNAIWVLRSSQVQPRTFRVISVLEREDHKFEVTALFHDTTKYLRVEQGINIEPPPFSVVEKDGVLVPLYPSQADPITPPSDLYLSEEIYGPNDTTNTRLAASWQASPDIRVRAYQVQVFDVTGGMVRQEQISEQYIEFDGLELGAYTVRLRAVALYDRLSSAIEETITLDGLVDPPGAPEDLIATGGVRNISLTWTLTSTRRFKHVEIWKSSNSTFSAGSSVAKVTATAFVDSGLMPNQTWYYWVRTVAVDGTTTSGWVGPVFATTSLLIAADIADGILNTAKFAAGITPVELFAALPSTGNFEGRQVYNTTDGRLYVYRGGAFEDLIPEIGPINAEDIVGQLTSDQIADLSAAKLTGQITSTQIEDGAISTPKLDAGAVITEKIAAGAVTTTHLSVGSASNQITNSCFIYDTAGWTAYQWGSGPTGVSFYSALGTGQDQYALVGFGSAMLRPTPIDVAFPSTSGALCMSGSYSVSAGRRYHAAAEICAGNGASTCINILWLDSSGTLLTEHRGNLISGSPFSGTAQTLANYGRSTIIATAPANAVRAIVRVVLIAGGTAGPWSIVSQVMFGESVPNATEVPPWEPGGVVQISGGQVLARTITTDRIQVNSITANELQANSVSADKLQANSVIFGKVAAGAIRSSEIAAGEIRATHLASETIITQAAQIGTGVIGTAQIGDAVISSAKIGSLQVNTGNIANNAVTASAFSIGSSSAGVSIYRDSTTAILLLAHITVHGYSVTSSSEGAGGNTYYGATVALRRNGGNMVVTEVSGARVTVPFLYVDVPSEGAWSYSVEVNSWITSPVTISGATIVALALKK